MNITTINATPILRMIFLTQFLWGFAYFTFISVLASFLEKTMHTSQAQILILLWGFYITGLVFSSIIGLIQDYWLGTKRSLYLGVTLALMGYLSMFLFEYIRPSELLLFPILAIVATGKTIVSNAIYVLLGKVYPPTLEDSNIERLITIDYIVTNIGALLGTFVAGIFLLILNENTTLFIALGISAFSFFCLNIFGVFLKRIGNNQDFRPVTPKNSVYITLSLLMIMGLEILCLISEKNIYWILIVCVVFSLIFFAYQYLRGSIVLRTRLLFVTLVLIQLFVFYFFYQQGFNLVNIYTRKIIPTLSFFGFEIKPQFFSIFNYFWVILAGMFLLFLHRRLEAKNIRISVFYQTSIAILLSLGAFVLLYISTFFISHTGFISLWWIFGFYFLQSNAEIIIAYVGISLFIKLMPSYLTSFGLGLRATVLTLPALFFSIPGQVDALHLNTQELQPFFHSQFLTLLLIGTCLYIPIILLQPIIRWIYTKKASTLKDEELEKQI